MIRNYLTFAFRNLNKRKFYSFINVFGVSIAVAMCLIILRYVDFELSYDRHHTKGAHIYRTILTRYMNGEFRDRIPATGYGTGPALLADLPEITNMARVHPMFGGAIVSSVENTNPVQFREERSYLTDPSFLQIFTFEVVHGDLNTALDHPTNIVVTRSRALKYFGHTNVIGETLKVTSGFTNSLYTVTAVIEDQPENSSLQFDFLFPLSELLQDKQYQEDDGWGWKNFITYIQVHANTDINTVTQKMPDFISKYKIGKLDITFQPLFDIHTQIGLAFDSPDRISHNKIYFFVLIAIFILCIAWINYVNLATARAMERAREVGIKKVIGAQKKQLITQFLLESAILNFVSVMLALLIAFWLLPYFGNIVGRNLVFDFYDARLWLSLVALGIFGSLVAGVYPAFILSSFKITTVLKAGAGQVSNSFPLRKILVVFQFACSLILISMTFVIYRQVGFMEQQAQGLNMDQILIVRAPNVVDQKDREQRLLTFKHQVDALSGIKSVCSSAGVPGGGYTFTTPMIKQGDPHGNRVGGNVVWVDRDFIQTYEIEMLSGKVWEPGVVMEPKSVIINETAMSNFQIANAEDALQQQVIFENDTFAIAGVMKDYYWNSLKETTVPIIFLPYTIVWHTFSIKLSTNDYSAAVHHVEKMFKSAFPGNPFEYHFLDDYFNQQYRDDENFGKIFSLFAAFAVIIACLGLLGLTAFTTEKKRKEISVRKVLGASTGNIVSLLSKDFVTLILVSSVISIPVMWYATSSWLNSFAFRISLSWDIFIFPVLTLTLVCLSTVSINIIRGTKTNPADVLKSE